MNTLKVGNEHVGYIIHWSNDCKLSTQVQRGQKLLELIFKISDTEVVKKIVINSPEDAWIKKINFDDKHCIVESDCGQFFLALTQDNLCKHDLVLEFICADCGMTVSHETRNTRIVQFTQSHIELDQIESDKLMISTDYAEKFSSKVVIDTLNKNRLFLILDLDHTLIHASNTSGITDLTHSGMLEFNDLLAIYQLDKENDVFIIDSNNINDSFKYKDTFFHYSQNQTEDSELQKRIQILESQIFYISTRFEYNDINSPFLDNFFKIRPGTIKFLQKISKNYELILYTAGKDSHAYAALSLLDPEMKFFKKILTRDAVDNNGLKSLYKILPSDHHMMAVIDDTKKAWVDDIALGICYPYVYFSTNIHFIYANANNLADIRLEAAANCLQNYDSNYILHVLMNHNLLQNPMTENYLCDILQLKSIWKINKMDEITGRYCPFKLNDNDFQLRVYLNVFNIMHQLYFDAIRHQYILTDDEQIKVVELSQILKSMISHVLKGYVILYPAEFSEFKFSSLYDMAVSMGAEFVIHAEIANVTHILKVSNISIDEIANDLDLPIISLSWLLAAVSTFWRPQDTAFKFYDHRVIWDKIEIIDIVDTEIEQSDFDQFDFNLTKKDESHQNVGNNKKIRYNDDCKPMYLKEDEFLYINYNKWFSRHNYNVEEQIEKLLQETTVKKPRHYYKNCLAFIENAIYS